MNSYRAIKGLNIILGGVCLGLQAHVMKETHRINRIEVQPIDIIFIIVVAIAVAESVLALLTLWCIKNPYPILDVIVKSVAALALFAAGGLLIYSAFDVKDVCSIRGYYLGCQPFEVKLAAGIICVINGICHASAKRGHTVAPGVVYHNSPAPVTGYLAQNYQTQPAPAAPMIIQQNSSYNVTSAPGSEYQQPIGFQTPRFQVQNPSTNQYNNNYNPNQGGYQYNNDYKPNPADYQYNSNGIPFQGGYQYNQQSQQPFSNNYPQQHRY